jgi:excisionase family DNA binding protein
MKRTLSTVEAAEALGLHRTTVYTQCVEGLLPAERSGIRGTFRIKPADLRKFAEQYNYPLDLPENAESE